MTRIVVDPDELKKNATYVAEASSVYSGLAEDLRSRELPQMPRVLTDSVTAGLDGVAKRLDNLSASLDGIAFLLRSRAAMLDGDLASRLVLQIGRDLHR